MTHTLLSIMSDTMLAGTLLFLAVTVLLVIVLLVAKKYLVAAGCDGCGYFRE